MNEKQNKSHVTASRGFTGDLLPFIGDLETLHISETHRLWWYDPMYYDGGKIEGLKIKHLCVVIPSTVNDFGCFVIPLFPF